jgi:hypothetical protein
MYALAAAMRILRRSKGCSGSMSSNTDHPLSSCSHLHRCPCEFCGRQVVERTVRTVFVVILSPSFNLSPGVTQTGEPVCVQAFIAQAAVHVGVLHRLAWLNEIQAHTTFFAPGGQCSSRETPARCPSRLLPASLAHWQPDPTPAALATRPARCLPRWPGTRACNRPRWSTCELLCPCSRNHSRSPSISGGWAWLLRDWLPHHSSGSAAAANPHRQSFLAI